MKTSICPWWLGFLLINPLRKLVHNPDKLFQTTIKPGMRIIDYGSAMGYFSLPMAKMAGDTGKVYCFDIQKRMLEGLVNRAKKAKLEHQIVPCLISQNENYNNLNGTADFVLLFAVAHEVPDQQQLFYFLHRLTKQGGSLFFAEPKGHVNQVAFNRSVSIATEAGYTLIESLKVRNSNAVLLRKV
jgi:2-polyprenyl-3-methyl-5-hydroxy-6-metoxy-1,4-benzoquinol methylase